MLYSTSERGEKLPRQHDLLQLLRKRPGLWASLFSFVRFLSSRFACDLNLGVDPSWLSNAAKSLRENKLLALYQEAGSGEAFERRWISAALASFHGLRRAGTKTFLYRPNDQDETPGFSVFYRDLEYWVPAASPPSL
ncbi:hypothetical protein FQZ97_1137010 [compost metagenome]